MGRNIEIKARLANPDTQAVVAMALADGEVVVLHQRDTFFRVSSGRLKLREFSDGTGELIHYDRPDAKQASGSDYAICPTADPARLLDVLEKGLGIVGRVTKTRRLVMHGQTRIHLDDVDGLGSFLELEVVLRPDQSDLEGTAIADDLMRRLGIRERDLVSVAYLDLLEQSAHRPRPDPR